MLTLLATDEVPGLQILLETEGWVDVPPRCAFSCSIMSCKCLKLNRQVKARLWEAVEVGM